MDAQFIELDEIAKRLRKLETEMKSIHRLLDEKGILQKENQSDSNNLNNQEILTQLLADGIWRESTEQEQQQAKKWQDLPEPEKEQVIFELENIPSEYSLSKIIDNNRERGEVK